MSIDRRVRGDRRQMEVDHYLLAGGIAEALRGLAQSHARHLAESSHATTTRAYERRDHQSRTERRGSGEGGVFAIGLRTLCVAVGRGRSTVGQVPPGASPVIGNDCFTDYADCAEQ